MPEFVYMLCGVTSMLCAGLLLRSYIKTRSRLLMWSSFCFAGLAINNILLFVDFVVVPTVDLRLLRSGSGVIALALLLIGLVWESR
jgi:hypothetical protein